MEDEKMTRMADWQWYFLDASTTRTFRLGEYVRAGEQIGNERATGRTLASGSSGKIVRIEYDVDEGAIILAVAQARPTANCPRLPAHH